MSFWDRLAGSTQERQFKGILRRAEKKTRQKKYGPMGDVGLALIQAAVNCRDVTKQWISADTEGKRLVREAYVYFEYIFLYMHLAKRQAFADLNEIKAGKLLEYLGQLVPHVAIDSYCAHWSDEIKQKLIKEFFENLVDADNEYADAVEKSPDEDSSKRFLSIFFLLSKRITDMCSYQGEQCEPKQLGTDVALQVMDSAVSEWKKMKLHDLMVRVSHAD